MTYRRLKHKCTITGELLAFAERATFSWDEKLFSNRPLRFAKCDVPVTLTDMDPTLLLLRKTFSAWPAMYRNDPYTYCDWHKDDARGCAVNLLLKATHSCSAFLGTRINRFVSHFSVLDYEPDVLYLFDTQVPHAVFNYEGDRVLFTLSFFKPHTYEATLAACEKLGLA